MVTFWLVFWVGEEEVAWRGKMWRGVVTRKERGFD